MAVLKSVANFKWLATVVLVVTCFGLFSASLRSNTYLKGIDVSRYQKEVNWTHVKQSNVSFAFVKATEGRFIKDPYFKRNWEHTRKQGIKRGAYHFYIPWVPVQDQIAHFRSTVTLRPGDLPPVLDVEKVDDDVTDAELRRDVKIWLTSIQRHYGVKPIIYTNQVYYQQRLKGHFKGYHFWIASYKKARPETHPQDKCLFWQYSESGNVKGIGSAVDMNYFYGGWSALNRLCVK